MHHHLISHRVSSYKMRPQRPEHLGRMLMMIEKDRLPLQVLREIYPCSDH
jgi:hypothetical protein